MEGYRKTPPAQCVKEKKKHLGHIVVHDELFQTILGGSDLNIPDEWQKICAPTHI